MTLRRDPTVCFRCGGPLSDNTLRSGQIVCHLCANRVCTYSKIVSRPGTKKPEIAFCMRETPEKGQRCKRHGGKGFYFGRKKPSVFKPEYVTDAKRATRGLLYQEAAKFPLSPQSPILLMAGRSPAAEIRAAKAAFSGSEIWALDRDPEAVRNAVRGGADISVCGDFSTAHDWSSPCCFRTTNFRFLNLDLCSNLNDDTAELIRIASMRSSSFAVAFSYGFDDVRKKELQLDNPLAWWFQGYDETLLKEYLADNGISKATIARIFFVLGASRREWDRIEWFPRAIFFYRGHRMPLISMLLEYQPLLYFGHRASLPVLVRKVRNEDLRDLAIQAQLERGTEYACSLFDVTPRKIAAWKAVRTREARGSFPAQLSLGGTERCQEEESRSLVMFPTRVEGSSESP